MQGIIYRKMLQDDWPAVADLINHSTNSWYESHGMAKVFSCEPRDTQLFCKVYEDLDPGCCWIAVCSETGRLAGSCFYHPRQTHVSLGIMNVSPDFFGLGVARQLLSRIIDFSEEQSLPLRLVSSALNLDSFSLYSKNGFVPQTIYQDLVIKVPEEGMDLPTEGREYVRPATLEDVDSIVALEKNLVGIERYKDYKYFIENKQGIWATYVYEKDAEVLGVLTSVRHPASCMIGPGVATNEQIILALISSSVSRFKGKSAVFLLPAKSSDAIQQVYKWGARNCELHFSQVRGLPFDEKGIFMPSFMPETS